MEHIKPSIMSMGRSDNLIPELPHTAYSCGQHRLVTDWFRSPRQGNVISLPKTSTFLEVERSTLSITMELLLLKLNLVLLEFPFVNNLIASNRLQRPAGYEIVLLKHRENVWSCIHCFPPWPACLFTTTLHGIKLSDEDNRQLGYEHNFCQNAMCISTFFFLILS
jgi:hypothetical protein